MEIIKSTTWTQAFFWGAVIGAALAYSKTQKAKR